MGIKIAEQLLEIYNSKEFGEYITSLRHSKNFDINIKDSLYIIYHEGSYYIAMPKLGDMEGWYVVLNRDTVVIVTPHTISRYRKRQLKEELPEEVYNTRGNSNESILDRSLLNNYLIDDIILFNYIIDGLSINAKYSENESLMLVMKGVIPLKRLKNNIYRTETFIDDDLLTDEQVESINKVLPNAYG